MSEFGLRPPAMGRFAIGEIMGRGMQASVRRGKDLQTGQEVALRIVERRQLTPAKLQKLEQEIGMMKVISHPNVIALKYVEMDLEWQRRDGSTKRVALMVLELADNGELFDYLMYSGHFSDEVTRAYMRQLLSALTLCHSKLIYHRDIKPENILLDSNFQLKLADFGLSTAQEQEDQMLQTDCGTKSYMAPEVIACTPYRGENADIWSSAVVMFTMLCGNPPFQVANRTDWWFNAISLRRHDRFWAAHLRSAAHVGSNTLAQNFLNHIFLKEPEERFTLEAVMADPWMTSGLQLSPEQLKTQMMQKKLAVTQGKEREAREAANRARRSASSGGGQFDPFAAATTYRGVGSEIPELAACVVEKLTQTSFFSSITPVKLVSGLKTAVMGIDAQAKTEPLSDGLYGLQIELKVGGDVFEFEGETMEVPAVQVHFDARLTAVATDKAEPPVYGIELVRTAGDMLAFQQAFKQVRSYFQGLESSAAVAEDKKSEEFFPGSAAAAEEEAPLTENIGMI
jgi:serine/threonine protein kinase